MPEEWNQSTFDDHVHDANTLGRKGWCSDDSSVPDCGIDHHLFFLWHRIIKFSRQMWLLNKNTSYCNSALNSTIPIMKFTLRQKIFLHFLIFMMVNAGIWFFLMPVILTVSHRMIPFFSSRVLDNYVLVRPYWILWLMLFCSISHGVLHGLDALPYLWIVDIPLALSALYLSFTWGLLRSFRVSLLAVLHISFAWLSLSMLLYGIQSWMLMQSAGESWLLGLAPLHALAIGYFASMILAMASRVTIGHCGRPLVLDNVTWWLFIGFQSAAIVRILPDVIPAVTNNAPLLYLLAGIIWLACFLFWAVRYVPVYWRKRIDGKAG
jgi:uncharacterized protein involved in response to NO